MRVWGLALLWTAIYGLWPVGAEAATYYVSASQGNDANNGTSEASPWKTIAKVNGRSFSPGDRILFRRGEVWNEMLKPGTSGTSANPIIYADYGNGRCAKVS